MTFDQVLYKYKSAYYNFPNSLKLFLGTVYGSVPLSIRFGSDYTLYSKIIKKFEDSDDQFRLDYMYNKTLETLIFSEQNIPYYKDKFLEYGVSSNMFKEIGDIKLFPELTKDIINNNFNTITSDKYDKAITYYSGGSLTQPSKYLLPSMTRAKEKAYNDYIFSKINFNNRDKTLLLKGRELSNIEKNIYWDYDPIENYLFLSNNYLNSDKFPIMYQKAFDFKPKIIFGYPSSIISFIKQLELHGFKKINPEAILLASETVYPDDYKIIQDYFNTDILSHYGHTERSVIGYRVNNGKYHFLNSYGLTRVDENSIVSTTYDNLVMPLINYKGGDEVIGDVEYYDNSDIAKTVDNISGRTQDFLVTKDYRLVSITTMCGGQHLPRGIDSIQYLQDEVGKVNVLVEGSDINTKEVEQGLYKLVRDGITFNVKHTEKIKKSLRGKRIIAKQSLDIEKIRKTHIKADNVI